MPVAPRHRGLTEFTGLLGLIATLWFSAAPTPAQPPPPPPPMLWMAAGGAIGETADLRIEEPAAINAVYALAMSAAMNSAYLPFQLGPPIALVAAGQLDSQGKARVRIALPYRSSLIGTVVHLQAATISGSSMQLTPALTWAAASPNTRSFVRAVPAPQSVSRATVESLADGRFLFSGGLTGSWPQLPTATDSLRIYDPLLNRFQTAGKLTTARFDHVARRLGDGTILIAGGADFATSTTAELYDPRLSRVIPVGSMPYRLLTNPAIANVTDPRTGNEYVLIAGGGSAYMPEARAMLYDVHARTFTQLPNMTGKRTDAAVVSLPGTGAALLIGGADGLGHHLDTMELFEISTRRFYPWGQIVGPRALPGAIALSSRHVLVTGGFDSATYVLSDVQVIDAFARRSVLLPLRLVVPRGGHRIVARAPGTYLHVGGGSLQADADRVPERLSTSGSVPLRVINDEWPYLEFTATTGGSVLGWAGAALHYLF